MGCGQPLCRHDGVPSHSIQVARQDRCVLRRSEVCPHSAKCSQGRVSHRQVSPIKSGPQPVVQLRGGFAVGCPLCYHCQRLGAAIWGIPVDLIPQRRARVTCSRARVDARRSLAYAHTRIVRPRTWTCDARSRRAGLRPGPLDSPDQGAVHGARRPRQDRAMRRLFSRARIRATSRARIRATQSESERVTADRMSGRARLCPTESDLSHLIRLIPLNPT